MSTTELADLTCEVCNDEPAKGVAAIPGIPASVAYGPKCLAANAHPWWAIVANTANIGGLDNAAAWWRQMAEDTMTHLGKTRAELDAAVAQEIAEYDAAMAAEVGSWEDPESDR